MNELEIIDKLIAKMPYIGYHQDKTCLAIVAWDLLQDRITMSTVGAANAVSPEIFNSPAVNNGWLSSIANWNTDLIEDEGGAMASNGIEIDMLKNLVGA